MKEEFNPDKVGEYLLDSLVTVGLMESDEALKLNVSTMLSEAVSTANQLVIKGTTVNWDDFKLVYTNYESYPTPMKVLMQLGVDVSDMQKPGSATTALRRAVNHFSDSGKTINGNRIPGPGDRSKYYSAKAKHAREMPEPSADDIDPGSNNRRTKTTLVIDKINKQEIISGTFYANRTRIPKSRWFSWLRFWKREAHSVKPNKFSLTGRYWGKTFIMGYAIDQKLFVEIWYNSLDSTFSIYDRNGVALGTSVETVQEAIKYLTLQVARTDTSDEDFFSHGINNGVAQSMMRALSQGLTADSSAKRREDILKGRHGQDDEKYAQGRSAVRNKLKKKATQKQARKDWVDNKISQPSKEWLKNKATKMARQVIMNDDKPVDYEEFKRRILDDIGAGASEISKAFTKDFPEAFREYKRQADEKFKKSNWNDETRPDMEEQRKREQEAREREKRQEREREEFAKEFSKRHGSGLKNSVERARERLQKQQQAAQNADSAVEREEIARRAREQLQRDIEAEGEADETPVNQTGGLGNYYGDIKSRRKKFNEETDPTNDGGELKQQQMDHDNSEPADVDHTKIDAEVKGIRNMAERSPYTQAALKGKVMGELFDTYTTTRADDAMNSGRFSRWLTNVFFKGRRQKLVAPTDYVPVVDKIRMGIKGQKFRTDFIIGFTLADKVNVEIWYVTEPSVETNKWGTAKGMVSSFYVYDVTSKTVIRKYLPYYRNAVQVAYAKIGTTI